MGLKNRKDFFEKVYKMGKNISVNQRNFMNYLSNRKLTRINKLEFIFNEKIFDNSLLNLSDTKYLINIEKFSIFKKNLFNYKLFYNKSQIRFKKFLRRRKYSRRLFNRFKLRCFFKKFHYSRGRWFLRYSTNTPPIHTI
jgi:hypothetical protein